ncbi:MAG: excisionase family DNA-binding protein [Phycisphaerales bacterium]|nr:excisionase family DNA-binding protein [Phycisphaerales bacterium]
MEQTLSPSQLARSIGVSESSLKRWVDDGALTAVRTVGGHRRIPMNEAVRFIRSIGATVVRPDLIGLGSDADLPSDWTDTLGISDRLYRVLEAGDLLRSRALIHGMYVAGWSPAKIFDLPLRSAMQKIGELWIHAEWGIVIEHRATNIVIQSISQLRALMPDHRPEAPFAVGCALECDPYLLPSLMASVTLAHAGFSDVNLGPVTPARVLVNAAEHYKARVAWLSVSSIADEPAFMESIHSIAARLAAGSTSCRLVVGGRVITQELRAQISPVATVCGGMEEFELLGKSLLSPAKPDPG